MIELCRNAFSPNKENLSFFENDEDVSINKKYPIMKGLAIPYPTNYIKKMNKKAFLEFNNFYSEFLNKINELSYLGSAISSKKKGNIVSYYNDLSNNKFYEILYDKVDNDYLIKMVVIFDNCYLTNK